MKILSVNKFYWKKGGSETVFFAEKALLEQHGHTVVPFSMQHAGNLETPYSQYFVSESDYEKSGLLNKAKMAMTIIYSFEAKSKMQQLLEVYQPDVAHFHIFQHQISPSVFTPLKRRGVPLILTLHDLKPICPSYLNYNQGEVCEKCYGQKFYQCTVNKCTKGSYVKSLTNSIEMYLHYALGFYQEVDKYIAVSQFYRQKMLANGFREDQVCYLPNPIAVEQYQVATEDKGYVLYFGRLTQEKGVDILLEAAKRCPGITFKIVGTGPLLPDLQAQALGLTNVEFLGFKSGNELTDLVSQSAFTVLPSRWYENCPMSALESMAMGKPVLGARMGGIPELINEGVDGFTFAPNNPEDLAEKISLLHGYGKHKRQEMGMQGRAKIERDFAAEQHYQKLLDIYNSVLPSS